MHKFVRNLITEWRRLELPFEDETLVVAISGGADSVSLLLAIDDLVKRKKLGHRVVAAHFNHKLRGDESDGDEQFVRSLTMARGIEFAAGRGSVPTAGNLEQNARNSRYEFLRQTAQRLHAYAVLTGHTVSDQAETLLLNLIRGSGPDGLGGMKTVRPLADDAETLGHGDTEQGDTFVDTSPSPLLPFSFSPPLLIRPLLKWAKRIDTEAFCRDLGVEYRYDTMNEDTAFKRIRIRKILLPLLEDMNPKIVETLANTATLMQDLSDGPPNGIHSPVEDELILGEVKRLPKPELCDIIRIWLKKHRGTMRRLQLKHIDAVYRLITSTKSGRMAEIPGGRVIKSGGRLVYEENKVEN